MLGSRMTTQDEDEVEEELAALEAETTGAKQELPTVPNQRLPEVSNIDKEAKQPEPQAMLAS